jgi:hypothetical protein
MISEKPRIYSAECASGGENPAGQFWNPAVSMDEPAISTPKETVSTYHETISSYDEIIFTGCRMVGHVTKRFSHAMKPVLWAAETSPYVAGSSVQAMEWPRGITQPLPDAGKPPVHVWEPAIHFTEHLKMDTTVLI